VNAGAPNPTGQAVHSTRIAASAVAVSLALGVVLAGGAAAQAEGLPAGDRLRLAYTPKVFHVYDDPDFVDWNHIVALEWLTPRHTFWGADRTHFGVSLFDNSYGQFSQSVYAGLEWDWTRALGGDLFFSVSAGLVHGYKEPYEDKLPLNNALGVGLTVVPALGWQRGPVGLAASLTGSAFAFRASWTFEP
jgi:hypothetical protein